MRVLFVHNDYLHRGGEDESRALEMRMLRTRGHQVDEYELRNEQIERRDLVSVGLNSAWNRKQYNHIRQLIQQTQPDVMKVDNFFPLLSPSIFDAAKSLDTTTVLSVRNYRLICPSANLYRSGQICRTCVGQVIALPALLHGCYRNSRSQSTAIVASNALGHIRTVWQNKVDRYVAVSPYVKQELIAGGFPAHKIAVKPNFIPDTGEGPRDGNYALYVGRLSVEKGILGLLTAWERKKSPIPLRIIGDGPLQTLVEDIARRNSNIEYLGRLDLNVVLEYIGRALCLVFPSQWPEPFGRTIIEAYSKGTPVVAAATTPIRDMVQDGHSGVLFAPGNGEECIEAVISLSTDTTRLRTMQRNARSLYLAEYTEEINYKRMIDILESACHREENAPLGSHNLASSESLPPGR